jgi:hypothetical protein
MTWWGRHRKKLVAMFVIVPLFPITHLVVGVVTRIDPPHVELPPASASKSWTRTAAGVRAVYLEGSPEAIGAAHARLLRDGMLANEGRLWDDFKHFVPLAPARVLMLDMGRVRYRHVDRGMPEPRRREIAAQAAAFAPDPFTSQMPTFQRMLFLHALYDIALGFEHSPMIGCTTFGLGAGATADGHVLLARAFDFETDEIIDREKAVFFVKEDGRLPIASVAWTGLIGVVSGMNLEGVSIVVHGARAKEPVAEGLPVAFSLRDVLQRAHDTSEAIAILKEQRVMVSHIVMVGDARGKFAVVERAPGVDAWVKDAWPDLDRVGVTNHLEGPLKEDPKNRKVEAETTTRPRRDRLDELLAEVKPRSATIESAVGMLRDHACAAGHPCLPGDRRSIDAFIATHGIVADSTDRALWVSAGPHLSGKFVRFDLRAIFAGTLDVDPKTTGEDSIKESAYR